MHELVLVGRDPFVKSAQLRVSVAGLYISQDLVIGAVLLDDIDDVLNRLGSPTRSGTGRGGWPGRGGKAAWASNGKRMLARACAVKTGRSEACGGRCSEMEP